MCIAILTTEHPQYPFILLNNRDEYLHRPTAEATWWDAPSSHVVGGYDMFRTAHGTWLGLTRQGRFAVLTNYREDNEELASSARSRGTIPNGYLKPEPGTPDSPEEYARRLVDEGTKGVGGFSLLYGHMQDVVKNGKGAAIISNRTPDVDGLIWVGKTPDQTLALSNSFYGDRTWPKVVNGEKSVKTAIRESVEKKESQKELIERMLDVMSVDTMPRQKESEDWDTYMNQLRHSIFIPALHDHELSDMPKQTMTERSKSITDTPHGVYGTQKQSIIMVDKDGKLMYLERTLFDGDAKPIERGKGDRVFEFQIENW